MQSLRTIRPLRIITHEAKEVLSTEADKLVAALEMCFADYNGSGIARDQAKYKLSAIDMQSIKNLLLGVDPKVLSMMKFHLDLHKESSAGWQRIKTEEFEFQMTHA